MKYVDGLLFVALLLDIILVCLGKLPATSMGWVVGGSVVVLIGSAAIDSSLDE